MHCWTKTLEKHGKHFFLWLFLSVYQSKWNVSQKSGWVESLLCLLGFCELFIVSQRNMLRCELLPSL